MIKVNYDINTTLVLGYYPDSVKYNSIPTPNIEIEDNAQILDKATCVKNGVYQEFVKPDSELLQEAKDSKITEAKREASNLITSSYPLHTQLNYLAEVSTIQDKQINGDVLTQEELDLLDKAREVKTFINNIRTQSQNFVNQVIDCTTIEEVIVDGVVTVEGKTAQQCIEEVNNIDITF